MTTMIKPEADRSEIKKTIKAFFSPDDLIEVRAIYKNPKRIDSGYFDGLHRNELIEAAIKANRDGANVYVSMNPIKSELLGRSLNALTIGAKKTTNDNDIIRRRWLLIDVDPERPSGTAATDEQVQSAKEVTIKIFGFLKSAGWPDSVCAFSGNGVHLLYPIDLPNDKEAKQLVNSVLETLGKQFGTKEAKVDTNVANASRITKLYGTVSTKGEHSELTPWRLSRITSKPQEIINVTPEQLRAILPRNTDIVTSDNTLNAEFQTRNSQGLPPWLPDALKHINSEPYDNWIKVGMVLHNATGGSDKGLAAYTEWSQAAENFDPDACREKWASFGNSQEEKVTLGTLFYMAKEVGWSGPKDENLTDAGNGKRLIRYFGENLRFVPEVGKWLIFVNGHWKWDKDGGINRFAKKTTDLMVQDARKIKDDDKRQRLMKFALASENNSRLKAMIDLAATEQEAVLHQSSLDRNPDLLGIANGVLNLKTGGVRPGQQKDYITKKSNVELNSNAENCPVWLDFLDKILGGSPELINYLQKAIGYSLTGYTREQCLFFLHGTGANGKSTLLNVLKGLMGDYSMVIDPETIMKKNNYGGATPELARLKGTRVIITNEVEEGKHLAENRIKQMTGEDTIVARHLYKAPFEFKPEFKIWMAGNHKPTIKGTDYAIWRRIHLIPFKITIPKEEQDPKLTAKLKAELLGILQWAVEGAKEWRRQGLNPPKIVQSAVEEYRDEMDTLGHWIAECCVFDSELKTESGVLYNSYKLWCQLNGHYPMSQTRLGLKLKERGLKKVKSGKISWVGIGINSLQRDTDV